LEKKLIFEESQKLNLIVKKQFLKEVFTDCLKESFINSLTIKNGSNQFTLLILFKIRYLTVFKPLI